MRQQQQKRRKTTAAAVVEALEDRTLYNATISGLVHNDVNGDGIIDEFSVPPATHVYLDTNANGRRDNGELSVVTDLNGQYEFKDVPQGSYLVRFDLPAGWAPSNSMANVGEPVIFAGGTDKVSVPDALIRYTSAPWATVGQNAQHTGISPFRGGPLTNAPFEVTSDSPDTLPDTGDKFGTPLFTKFDTVVVPLFDNATQKFEVRAYSRSSGVEVWTFVSDYVAPPSVDTSSFRQRSAVFQPALTPDGKLYIPGAGGAVWLMATPDRFGSGLDRARTARRVVFYGKDKFHDKPGRYRQTVYINTPLTADANGNVYFGVESNGANPLGIKSSLARVRENGSGARARADVVAGSAPALSNDGSFVYVATQTGSKAYIARFHTGEGMAEAGATLLKDPVTHQKMHMFAGYVSLPVVAPDGDVYMVTPARKPSVANTGNGWLMHFSADLKVKGTQAQVMATETPSIVPASMVPAYHGRSTYLVAAPRYTTGAENPTGLDTQRLSLFDPAHSLKRTGAEFLLPAVQYGVDNQNNPQYTYGFVSSPVTVDPSSGAIYLVNAAEDLMRWSVSNVLNITAPVSLGDQFEGEGGSPVVIGPDGEVYAVVAGKLMAAF